MHGPAFAALLAGVLALPACADDVVGREAPVLTGGAAGSSGAPSGGNAGTTPTGGVAGAGGAADASVDAAAPLDCPNRAVSTLAGSSAGFKEGSAGPNGIARLDGVRGVAAFSTVVAFVADRNNHRIRNLLFDGGDCEVWAGSGVAGLGDGEAELAQLSAPEGVAVDSTGQVHVADTANHAIRRVVSAQVSTLAGDGSPGFADGKASRFNGPTGLAVDASGNVFIADRGNHAIRKVTAAGLTTTLAGDGSPGMSDASGASARFASPWGIALDAQGVLWVSDTDNDRVRRVDPSGAVTTFAGGDGSLDAPMGIAVDAFGKVYVADSGHQRVVRLTPSGALELVAGSGSAGTADGPAASAQFSALAGLALAEAYAGGGLLVGDAHRVRLVHCQ